MWTCHKCNSVVEDDDFAFCWNCNEERKGSNSGWTCSNCNTTGIDAADEFCFGCGQQKETTSQSMTAATSVESSIKPIAQPAVAAPVSLSILPVVQSTTHLAYDASVFASQFPQWDLQPPAVMVRRVKRSL
jgi:hypothetical protein